MKNRLFIALNIHEDIQERILEIRNSIFRNSENVKWEKKEKYHFTLKFLGDVEQSENSNIIKALAELTENHKSFNIEFDKFGLFLNRSKPAILWLGIKQNRNILRLQSDLDCRLNEIGFERGKKKYHPHLTILRFRGSEASDLSHKFVSYTISDLKYRSDRVTLYRSTLLRSSSVYEKIQSFKLI
ncbi:MAG: RNA 2',3'-cyclic phosphodiesterase [Bacteroidetes bacterium]|nr:RNA 2',3'-cyclic phosphodiesterase [Bacteroidota bacterium]MBU1677915.1 RNA 2',3'-cyclic phosphodiesterase [Bacteroidota bacterium]MBU2507884.1 RNA 2',3'-cyclic phosphodiesterase [Bacteroidota bacterium]